MKQMNSRMLVKRNGLRCSVVLRGLMALVLMAGLCASAWADDVTVKNYLTSKSEFDNPGNKYDKGTTVSWSAEENAVYFQGGKSQFDSYIKIKDNPFAAVNSTSGFAISMDFKLFYKSDGTKTGPWARLFEATDNLEPNNKNRFLITMCKAVGSYESGYTGSDDSKYHMYPLFVQDGGYVLTLKPTDTNKRWWDEWHHLTLLVKPKGSLPVMYIDGVLVETTSADYDSGKYATLLDKMKDLAYLYIGKSSYPNDGCINGYVKNVQIASSGNVVNIFLKQGVESLSNGILTAKVSGSSSGQTVTKGGIIMPKGVNLVLTAVPNTGYYMSQMFLDKTTGASTSVKTKNASDAYTNPEHTFTFDDTYYAYATFAEREYKVVYDMNNDVTVDGSTTTETVEGMPSATDTKYKYFTGAFTFPSETPTRKGYTFKGWSNVKTDPLVDNSGITYAAGATVSADDTSSPTSDKGKLSSTVSDDNVLTLYAVWEKNSYDVNIKVKTIYDSETEESGTKTVNVTGGTITLKRAHQLTPNTWSNDDADKIQLNDKVTIESVQNNDYYLESLQYSWGEGEDEKTTFNVGDGYGSAESPLSRDFTLTQDKAITITAVFRHEKEYDITSNVVGAGSTASYVVTHRGESSPNKTKAMPNDQVKLQAAIANGYILRTVTYKFDGESSATTLYNGKTKNTKNQDHFTTDAFSMLGKNVTVTATFLQDRAVTVGGKTARGSITMTGKYDTSSGEVTTEATASNASLTAHSGDKVTVTATPVPTGGWHFDTSKSIGKLLKLSDNVTSTEVTKQLESASMTFTMPDADVTVTGVFTENEYTILYDSKGGTDVTSQTKKHFESVTLSNTVPTRVGYVFQGWTRTEGGTTVDYAAGATAGSELNGTKHKDEVKLYAVWKGKEYRVSVDPGINGGQVSVDKTQGGNGTTVTVSCTAYEGYDNPSLYYYTSDDGAKTAHPITITNGTGTFNIGEADVTVYATFGGTYDARKEQASAQERPTIENGDITVGGVSITAENCPKVGSRVSTVAVPSEGYRLKEIKWRKVSDAGMMRSPQRAADTEVDVEGWHTLTYDGTDPVTYSTETGEYVAKIEGVDSHIYMDGEFQEKTDLSTVSVTLEGPGDQQWTGSAITPTADSYVVKFEEVVQTAADYTIEWQDNTDVGKAKAVIKASATNERYKGTYTKAEAFAIVKAPTGTYTTDFTANFTYDGTEKTLTNLKVYKGDDKEEVTAGSGDGQYSLSYTNNVNAGKATARITINGSDGGTLIRNFDIKPKAVTITAADQTDVKYGDGIATTVDKATASGLIDSHSIASVTFAQSSTAVGSGDTHKISVSGAKIVDNASTPNDVTSNYSITYVDGNLTIVKKQLTITPIARTLEYGDALPTGDNALTALYSVTGLAYGETLTTAPAGYSVKDASENEVTLAQGTPAGAYKLTLSGAAANETNYDITYAAGDLTITQYDLTQATVEVTGATRPYTNTATKAQSVTLKKGDWPLPATDYTVKYGGEEAGQTTSGSYTITAEAKGTNVVGTATAETPLVIGKYDLNGAELVATISDQTFTGSRIRPEFSELKLYGTALSATDDYDVIAYGPNVQAGTGTVTIRAKEESTKFTGTRVVEFNIVKADLSATDRVTSAQYADYVMAAATGDTHLLSKSADGKTVTASFDGTSLELSPLSVKVRLQGGADDLSASDYTIGYKKGDGGVMDAIPADAIGEYQVVVRGKDPNTGNDYVTTDLKVKLTLSTTLPDETWVTYYDERFSLQPPTGYQAYVVTNVSNTTVTVQTVDYIPQGTPVLLNRTSGTGCQFELEEYTGTAASLTTYGRFVGVPSTGVLPTGYTPQYILLKNSFVTCEDDAAIDAHRCFLATDAPAPAPSLSISIVEGTTGVSEELRVKSEEFTTATWYTINGRKLSGKPTKKGLYIRNGVKIVIK